MTKVIITIEDSVLTGVLTKPNERVEVEIVDLENMDKEESFNKTEQRIIELDQKIEDGDLVNCM
ncbi:MAG: hypothetical protein IJI27_05340 [Oscillospiraceae bacterium]|nr:hypothetical protein [Oscillospiraceae bacterium]